MPEISGFPPSGPGPLVGQPGPEANAAAALPPVADHLADELPGLVRGEGGVPECLEPADGGGEFGLPGDRHAVVAPATADRTDAGHAP